MKDNLKEERLLILNMIQEGKITVEDGTRLLDAIKAGSIEECQGFDMEEKINKFSSSVDSFAKDVSSKVGTAFRDAEPKIKKATKKALEKTALVIEDISKSLNESVKNMEEDELKDNCSEDENCIDNDDFSSTHTNDDDTSNLS